MLFWKLCRDLNQFVWLSPKIIIKINGLKLLITSICELNGAREFDTQHKSFKMMNSYINKVNHLRRLLMPAYACQLVNTLLSDCLTSDHRRSFSTRTTHFITNRCNTQWFVYSILIMKPAIVECNSFIGHQEYGSFFYYVTVHGSLLISRARIHFAIKLSFGYYH